MIRFLAFAGAIALALSQPAVLLAEPAPPGAIAIPVPVAPVYHAAEIPVYHPGPRPAPAARPVMPDRKIFNGPYVIKPLPCGGAGGVRPLAGCPEVGHPAFEPALQPNPLLVPNRFRYWPGFAFPTYFAYPGSCYTGNGYWGQWGMLATPTFSVTSNTYAAAQQVDPQYGMDIGTLGGVYQGYAPAQPYCNGFFGL